MGRKRKWPPTVTQHNGQDRIRVDGRDYYLGLTGTDQAKREFARLVALLADKPRGTTPPHHLKLAGSADPSITISELVARWLAVAEQEYAPTSGEPKNFGYAVRPLVRLYGDEPAAAFDANALEAVMVAMATGSWMKPEERAKSNQPCWKRKVINRHATRIRTMWAWAEKKKLVPPGSTAHLKTAKLSQRDHRVRRSDPREPVKWEQIVSIYHSLYSAVAAMLHLQWLTGMRPEEVCTAKLSEIDRSSHPWVYSPVDHKNAWRGQARHVYLGKRAQLLLAPWMDEQDPERPLFRSSHAQKAYTSGNYAQAIRRACLRAGIVPFFPYAIRHAAKQRVERIAGTGGAKAFLGQESVESTKHYARSQDAELAKKLARKLS